jgi:hypothetical protein
MTSVISEIERAAPNLFRPRPVPVAPAAPVFREDEDIIGSAFREDEDIAAPEAPVARPMPAPDRVAVVERLERDATSRRFEELDRRSEALAAEQQRIFAQRLDAAIAAELTQLRQRREEAETRLRAWEAAERERILGELTAEEQRFGDRLMGQLNEFEAQLGERLREQEIKLDGWWREAELLADQRMRAALEEVETTARI